MFTNYKDFVNFANGKIVDMDGHYGAQCWDGFAWYCSLQGYPIINCTTSGYVKDIANNDKTNGILKNFNDITNTADLQEGDWVVFGTKNSDTPMSHIAMYVGNGRFFGQNQSGIQQFTTTTIRMVDMIGIYRDKAFINNIPFKTNGCAIAKYDKIRVRTQPSLSQGNTGLEYNTGMKLYYADVVVADGWYWLKYVRSENGAKGWGYCAYGTVDGKIKYWDIQ